jgi:hypothetical protein
MKQRSHHWLSIFLTHRAKRAALLAVMLASTALALRGDSRAVFLPQLKSGQSLLYEAHGRFDRKVKTESRVSSMLGPQELHGDLSNQIRLSIREVIPGKSRPIFTAQTEIQPGEGTSTGSTTLPSPKLSFNILANGQLGDINGLDNLSPEQRLLWQFWVARFAFGWTLPQNGIKLGEKWKFEDPELSDSLIAGLVWERETTYASNDKCPVFPGETCAVFLTQSTLKQKSSTKDSTPEEFRRKSLKTFGTAQGTNQVICYISLQTGLVLRAKEDVQQLMDVTVMKTDGTNGVHYTIDASSHLETLFVPQPAAPAQQ